MRKPPFDVHSLFRGADKQDYEYRAPLTHIFHQPALSTLPLWNSTATSDSPEPRTATTRATTAAADDASQALSSPAFLMLGPATPPGRQQCVPRRDAAVAVRYKEFTVKNQTPQNRCPELTKLPRELSKRRRPNPHYSSTGGVQPVTRVHCV